MDMTSESDCVAALEATPRRPSSILRRSSPIPSLKSHDNDPSNETLQAYDTNENPLVGRRRAHIPHRPR